MEADFGLNQPLDTLVVGAGLTGLTLGWHLVNAGRTVLLCEATNRVGGAISTSEADGFILEGGPNALQESPELTQLIQEIGMAERLLYADARLPRYIWWDSQLRAVPRNVPQFLRSDLLSWFGKARLLFEPFVPRLEEEREETVTEFVRRRLGDEVLTRLIDPFVSGIYAGDPGQLGATAAFPKLTASERDTGSLLRAQLQAGRSGTQTVRRLCSFRSGLRELPEVLAVRLGECLRREHQVVGLERAGDYWRAIITHRDHSLSILARSVVLTVPAYVSAQLLQPLDNPLGRSLESIYYPPVAVLNLGYPVANLPRALDGFGHLIPRGQGMRTLGGIWSSSLFAQRAPEGWCQITCFIGGTTDPSSQDLSERELVRLAHRDLQQVLGLRGAPKVLAITRWPRAIPQYALGHLPKQMRIEARLTGLQGIFLAGNYFGGVSLGDCVVRAQVQAGQVQTYLGSVSSQASLRSA